MCHALRTDSLGGRRGSTKGQMEFLSHEFHKCIHIRIVATTIAMKAFGTFSSFQKLVEL